MVLGSKMVMSAFIPPFNSHCVVFDLETSISLLSSFGGCFEVAYSFG